MGKTITTKEIISGDFLIAEATVDNIQSSTATTIFMMQFSSHTIASMAERPRQQHTTLCILVASLGPKCAFPPCICTNARIHMHMLMLDGYMARCMARHRDIW